VLSAADKQSKWRKPSPGVWVLLAGSLILVAVFLRNNMKAARIEEVLRQEFSALGSPPGATLVGMESHHKPGVVFIGHTFSFSSDFRTVKEYYEHELTRRGWVHNDERGSGEEVVIEYCKLQYAAKIDYFLNSKNPPRYTLYLDWGINNCR
jgi:hypothetical protein